MIIKERTQKRNFNTSNRSEKVKMDFPTEYGYEKDYIPNNYRATNEKRYINQFEDNYYTNNYNNFSNNQNAAYANEDIYFNDYNNLQFRAKSEKNLKTRKENNPRVIAMLCVFAILAIFVATLIAINAVVPANAENISENPIVNTARLEENIKNDMPNSIIIAPNANTGSSKNWFDALCDWFTK